jgi:hypothetical protein
MFDLLSVQDLIVAGGSVISLALGIIAGLLS